MAAALIVVAAGGLLYKFVLRTPQARLARGFVNMAKELQDFINPIAEEMDSAQVLSSRNDSGTVDLRLNVGLPQMEGLPTIGLDFKDSYDYNAKNLQTDFAVSIFNATLFQTRMTVIEDVLYMEIPNLLTRPYSVTLSSLGKDYNNSVWADLTGIQIADDYSYDFFAQPETGADTSIARLKEELREVLLADLTDMWDNVGIEESGDTKKIERNGETVVCDAIVVTLDKGDLGELLEDVSNSIFKSGYVEGFLEKAMAFGGDFTGETVFRKFLTEVLARQIHLDLEDDVQICFYLDNKDRILAIETYDTVHLKDSKINDFYFSFEFTGSERTLDHVSGEISLKLSGHEMTLEIGRITANGALQDTKTGGALTLELSRCTFSKDGEAYLTLSGALGLKPFKGSIKAPKDAGDFFDPDESEIYQIIMEWVDF